MPVLSAHFTHYLFIPQVCSDSHKNISQIHACSFFHSILFFVVSFCPKHQQLLMYDVVCVCVCLQGSYAYKLLLWYVGIFARKYLHAYVFFMEINYVAFIWQHF